MKFFFLIALSLTNSHGTTASPTGAATCNTGIAVGGSHMGDDTGSLDPAGYFVSVGSDATMLVPNEPFDIVAAMKTPLTISADGNDGFRGFLIRMSAGGDDVSNALSFDDGESEIKTRSCPDTVAGLTHTNRELKKSVTAYITAPCNVEKMIMEVTVVRANGRGSEDGWFYNLFPLAVDVGNCTNGNMTNMTGNATDVEDGEEVPTSGAYYTLLPVIPLVMSVVGSMFW